MDDLSNDDIAEFNLELQNSDILGELNPDDYNISYYITYADANSSINALPELSINDKYFTNLC